MHIRLIKQLIVIIIGILFVMVISGVVNFIRIAEIEEKIETIIELKTYHK